METKSVFLSKEMWVISLGILNYILNQFGLPSFEPTPEFFSALLIIIGTLRVWWTNSGLHVFKGVK